MDVRKTEIDFDKLINLVYMNRATCDEKCEVKLGVWRSSRQKFL